jgi:adhesin transport system membrane fusion protein
MGFNSKSKRAEQLEDIDYMSPVEAAIMARGRKSAFMLSIAIFLLLLSFLVWAALLELDEFTRAMGQVIPSQRTQVIQNLEGGIVEEILVNENSVVEKGALLMRINNEGAASGYRDAYSQSLELEGEIARLSAERDDLPAIEFPPQLREFPHIIDGQINLYNARRSSLNLELDVLRSQLIQKQQEVQELQSKRDSASQSLNIAIQEQEMARPLRDRKIYSEMDWLQLQRTIVSLRGDLNGVNASLPRAENAVAEIQKRIEQRQAVQKIEIIDELNKKRIQLQSLKESLAVGEDRVTRTEVRSPVRGTIKQILINTVGGVIRSGEPIMEIVPLDDTLLIEAKVTPSDIAFIQPRQKAHIQLTAYDPSIFGGLDGFVENISADTITGERGESFYRVTLRTDTNHILYRGTEMPILPGMLATVDIITGRKSVLRYLLKPIIKASQTALRER